MREYKFRGKREDGGGWAYGYYARCEDTHYIYQPEVVVVDAEINDTDNVLVVYPVIPETVGQFTGSYDNCGEQIYESDIVRWKHVSGFEDGQGVIEWDNDHCGFMIVNDDTDIFDSVYNFDHLEIIGNIHQEVKV